MNTTRSTAAVRTVAARIAESIAAAWYRITGTGYAPATGAPTGQAVTVPADAAELAAAYTWTKAPMVDPFRVVRRFCLVVGTVYVALGLATAGVMAAAGMHPAVVAGAAALGVLAACALLPGAKRSPALTMPVQRS